ncbi:MAG: M42 family peptidase [Candidatus Schekmanbacteria bacterium]|nr:M42 family peptidase [Candidatus Schekmanbacteria bacterium]
MGESQTIPPVGQILETLSNVTGPTGEESTVMEVLNRWWHQLGTVERTPIGNMLLRVAPDSPAARDAAPRLVIAAHADELSLMVQSIDANGFLRVIGGASDRLDWPYFVQQQVRVVTPAGELPGIFATTTGHVMTDEQRKREPLSWHHVFVDIGARSDSEAREWGVRVGHSIVWGTRCQRVGHYLAGKCFDDRVGLAIMTRLAAELDRRRLCFHLTLAATVQEEIGLIGGYSLGGSEAYDAAIVLDNGLAGDIPTVDPENMPVKLGGGPILVVRDSSVQYHRPLIAYLEGVAAAAELPLQRAILFHYGSDGATLTKKGLPTALLAPPMRYSHSPIEVLCEADLEATVALLAAFVHTPPPTFLRK